jgi:hypothetical protein
MQKIRTGLSLTVQPPLFPWVGLDTIANFYYNRFLDYLQQTYEEIKDYCLALEK